VQTMKVRISAAEFFSRVHCVLIESILADGGVVQGHYRQQQGELGEDAAWGETQIELTIASRVPGRKAL
jgi:hypothetical protein